LLDLRHDLVHFGAQVIDLLRTAQIGDIPHGSHLFSDTQNEMLPILEDLSDSLIHQAQGLVGNFNLGIDAGHSCARHAWHCIVTGMCLATNYIVERQYVHVDEVSLSLSLSVSLSHTHCYILSLCLSETLSLLESLLSQFF
jgi:hypothetical protein